MRKACATRFLLLRAFWRITFPPVMSLRGTNSSQLLKAPSLGNALRSGPNSDRITWAVMTSMPSMRVRSTPKMRLSSIRRQRRLIFRLVPSFAGALGLLGYRIGGCHPALGYGAHPRLQFHITGRDLLVVEIVAVHHLTQFKDRLTAPMPLQAMGYLLLAGLDAPVS